MGERGEKNDDGDDDERRMAEFCQSTFFPFGKCRVHYYRASIREAAEITEKNLLLSLSFPARLSTLRYVRTISGISTWKYQFLYDH